MKYLTPLALALTLGACAHKCDCAAVETAVVETTETVEVEETIVEAAEAPVVEEVVEAVEVPTVTETVETTVVGTESSTGRRVVTRRLVDEIDAGTPTAPAIAGSAADDALLSETPRVLEEQTFETTGTTTTTDLVETVVDAAEDAVEEAVDGN